MNMNLGNQKRVLLFIQNMIVHRRKHAYGIKYINKLHLFKRSVLLLDLLLLFWWRNEMSLVSTSYSCVALYMIITAKRALLYSNYDCCYLFAKFVNNVSEILSKFGHFSFKYENCMNFEQQSILMTIIAFKWDFLEAKLWLHQFQT